MKLRRLCAALASSTAVLVAAAPASGFYWDSWPGARVGAATAAASAFSSAAPSSASLLTAVNGTANPQSAASGGGTVATAGTGDGRIGDGHNFAWPNDGGNDGLTPSVPEPESILLALVALVLTGAWLARRAPASLHRG